MNTVKLVSSTIYSEETSYLLEIALYYKDANSFLICGLPVKNTNYNNSELKLFQDLKNYLIELGGKPNPINGNFLFCYIFDTADRKPVLEWYLDILNDSGQIVTNYNEVEKLIQNNTRIFTLPDKQSTKLLNVNNVLISSQGSNLYVWDVDNYYQIILYSESEYIPNEDRIISEMLYLFDRRVAIVTKRGDIFIIDVTDKSYEIANVIKLISSVKSVTTYEGNIIAGLENNTIQIYSNEGRLITTLNEDNIYRSFNIFYMGIFYLCVNEEYRELIAVSYDLYNMNYHVLVFNIDFFHLIKDVSIGNVNITGLVYLDDRIFISSINGEIKVISRKTDELNKIDIKDMEQIYKIVKISKTKNLLITSNIGLDIISYPDNHYHIPGSDRHNITTTLCLDGEIITGSTNGEVHSYNSKLGKSRTIYRAVDQKIIDIIALKDGKIAISTNGGEIIILR